ncbi:uncharacterized protein BJ171DRAFT_516881 [Polychytrium aggregatum]|uniref:uncharacterized protein n=1 Tax=Polychytrium aggregatum TaxID=110093 RepID=UPI0022FDBC71|nr:uncharacterized protein BJ171DRAFT_516881 [Polychytrium aggregatum]KAI9201909.1 hypothetical protein BJ171DRAFT_516881 [Polychytrium aggregatum]
MTIKILLYLLAIVWAVAGAPTCAHRGRKNHTVTIRLNNLHYMDGAARNANQNQASTTPNLVYYGGPVISNVQIIPIYYGSNVNFITQLNTFYKAIVGSKYITWLSEYNTPTQKIGAGTFGTPVAITSGLQANTNDAAIQTWLLSLVSQKKITPTANTYFPIHFAKGITITSGTEKSCVQFCAYHGTVKLPAGSKTPYLYYGVIPDQSGGCASGCGANPSAINNLQSVSSHELVESITDAGVGQATTYSTPLAWYDQVNGEIGDICNGVQGSVKGTDGNSYIVQKQWSNSRKVCYVPT